MKFKTLILLFLKEDISTYNCLKRIWVLYFFKNKNISKKKLEIKRFNYLKKISTKEPNSYLGFKVCI